jgi:hypothetical protein
LIKRQLHATGCAKVEGSELGDPHYRHLTNFSDRLNWLQLSDPIDLIGLETSLETKNQMVWTFRTMCKIVLEQAGKEVETLAFARRYSNTQGLIDTEALEQGEHAADNYRLV